MRAAIYNPYLDTLGGGERYTAGVISAFLSAGYKVDVQWNEPMIIKQIEDRFGLSLRGASVVDSISRGDSYDACFWVSDGSIPTLRSRNNIVHFQVPFKSSNGRTLMNKMKLFRIKNVVVNSEFTKGFIDNTYGVKSKVLYPPISVSVFKPKRKQNVIAYVGRFSALVQHKRQDVLVDVFKKFYVENKKWRLVLAGGVEVGNDGLVDEIKRRSKGYPVDIVTSPSFAEIKNLLGISKMFWSASGYGINELAYPEKVEHFGITVVEAMSAKCVPIVLNKGGHKEIVSDFENGFLFENKKEFLAIAKRLADDGSLLSKVSIRAKESSSKFSDENFSREFSKLI